MEQQNNWLTPQPLHFHVATSNHRTWPAIIWPTWEYNKTLLGYRCSINKSAKTHVDRMYIAFSIFYLELSGAIMVGWSGNPPENPSRCRIVNQSKHSKLNDFCNYDWKWSGHTPATPRGIYQGDELEMVLVIMIQNDDLVKFPRRILQNNKPRTNQSIATWAWSFTLLEIVV